MTIKGISDIRRLTRGGKFRLGIKVKNARGKMYPQKSDHFIADLENEETQKLFHEIYGDEPKRIRIAFPSNDPEQFFPQFYKCYGSGSGLKCRGDGERADRAQADGTFSEVDCDEPQNCEFAQENGCHRLASLQFFVEGLPGIEVFQVDTTGFHSIVNLNTGIELLQMLRGGRGIAGVFVDLVLVPQTAQAAGKKVGIFVMKLNIPVSLENAAQLTSVFEAVKELPPPDETKDELLHAENVDGPPVDEEPETVTAEVVDEPPKSAPKVLPGPEGEPDPNDDEDF